ncbi:MAG TPA: glycosyl transferase family 1 [Bacteroidales bacterium]|jgi:glycosyltransferase involved in cell wall biosynthesis|nr:glycosyl transferase family 1 [Bacteroidales bacterium]
MERPRKKVVIIGSAYPLRGGGIATFNERLAQAYQDRGDEVVIYTFSLQYPSIFFPGTTQFSKEDPPVGLNIKVKINSVNPLNWIRSAFKIAVEKPDLVIVRFWIPFMAPCLGSIARILRWRYKTKIIAITDNIIPHERRFFDFFLVKYFTGSVDGFVAMSKSVLNDISGFDNEKPRIYHPHPLYDNFGEGVSKEEACRRLSLDEKTPYMLFFGFIRDYKGLDLLLGALASSTLSGLNVRLLIAGEFYGNEEKYMDIIRNRNLDDKVVLRTSFIPNTEVYLYFSACDLVVQPYRHATQSGVTQIAYHFGKPIITTNVGGLAEMIPDGKVGYVVSPDPESIAKAIYRFYHEKKAAEFASNVLIERERFSWEGLLEEIDQIVVV